MNIFDITEAKAKVVRASDKKPKKIKPSTGHESPHPMQGKLVGEGNRPQKPKSYSARNPVAKNIEKFNRPATHMDKKKELKKKGPDIKSFDMDEATTLVANKTDIIDSILKKIKEKALVQDSMIKRLASLIDYTANIRFDNDDSNGRWEITPNDKLGKTGWDPMK